MMTADPATANPATIGAILAGGLARRLGGGDKTLRQVGGDTVLARLIERLRPTVTRLIINANDNPERFAAHGLPIVPDTLPDHPGPLAGVLAALDWTAASEPSVAWVVTAPGDAPFLPKDLVTRLHEACRREGAQLACAGSLGRTHPVVALWPVSIRHELRQVLTERGIRRIDRFTEPYKRAVVEWNATPVDPFFNVNTPEDLAEADRLVRTWPDL
ncbi:MAG TPA: molybdenum cofactor guanylyltransferase MobA [Acetobacteraceae bacterium]|nr:molybdenum cofactor guanylyltransferase MobA [Acetobacteraceae bacterium]